MKRERCMGTTRDGSRCGRMVIDGSTPALCHKHRPDAKAVGVIPPLDQFDPIAKLRKIASSDRHPQQLAAIRELRQSTLECPSCDRRRLFDAEQQEFIKNLTVEERQRLEAALRAIREVRQDVRVRFYGPAPVVAPEVIAAAPVVSAPVAVIEPDEPPSEPESNGLPRARWADVGLSEEKGIVTHANGDDHARAILEGRIPFETAQEAQRRAAHEDQITSQPNNIRRVP